MPNLMQVRFDNKLDQLAHYFDLLARVATLNGQRNWKYFGDGVDAILFVSDSTKLEKLFSRIKLRV